MDKTSRSSVESRDQSHDGLLSDVDSAPVQIVCRSCRSKRRFLASPIFPWLLSVVLSTALAILMFKSSLFPVKPASGFWREAEFEPATKQIPARYKQVAFKATLRFNETRQLYRPPYGNVDLVGPPNPEVDAAWDDLIGTTNVFVTREEAHLFNLDDELFIDPETGLHRAFTTVGHDLHCLNMIRKYLYLEQYPELMAGPTTKPHVEHCIDSIRESLMCTGDMTFIPAIADKNRGDNLIPKFDVEHTCRDFDAIKEWSWRRDSANEAVWRENAERLIATGI